MKRFKDFSKLRLGQHFKYDRGAYTKVGTKTYRADDSTDLANKRFGSKHQRVHLEQDQPRDPKGTTTGGQFTKHSKPLSYTQKFGPGYKKALDDYLNHGPHSVQPITNPYDFGYGSQLFIPYVTPPPQSKLDPNELKRIGPQQGSNPGGVFADKHGKTYYVKHGRSKDHVRNEYLAAKLYRLAHANIMKFRKVEGGEHIATEMQKLTKSNIVQFNNEDKQNAWKDFAAHAWLANWDVAGTGGDNLVMREKDHDPIAVDLGGALEYRAQGKPKGEAFGPTVDEIDTLRNPNINPDTAKVFGRITPAAFRDSAFNVIYISDWQIKDAVKRYGGSKDLTEKLIQRRDDIKQRMATFGQQGEPTNPLSTIVFNAGDPLPLQSLNGQDFKEWNPPKNFDWNEVDGQLMIPGEQDSKDWIKGKQLASGLIIKEPDGRIWLVRPKNGFGNVMATYPKGRVEGDLSIQANAIKEAWEESGIKARVIGLLGDFEGESTLTRYYLAKRMTGDPSKPGKESDGVILLPPNRIKEFVNRSRDQDIAEKLQ